MSRGGWSAGLALASLLCAWLAATGCAPSDEATSRSGEAGDAAEAVAAAPPEDGSSPYDGIELPPFEPLPLPPPELVRPPHWAPPPGESPPAAAAVEEDGEQSHASLEALLDLSARVPRGAPAAAEPRPVDLQKPEPKPDAKTTAATEPGAIDRLKNQVHVDTRSEPIGPKGPRQGTRSETDAGIRVPLDESVSVEGGVRVDQRKDPSLEEPERKSTPRVGVEVRF